MKTVEEAHAAGSRDGKAGVGAIPPKGGPPGSLAQRIREAYLQSYRDANVAKFGVKRERNRAPKKKGRKRYESTFKRYTGPKEPKYLSVKHKDGVKVGQVFDKVPGFNEAGQVRSIHKYANQKDWSTRVILADYTQVHVPLKDLAGKRRRVCGYTLGDRPVRRRKLNRVKATRAVLYAQRSGGPLLAFMGRGKFATRGRPKTFESRAAATAAGWVLRESFPRRLKGYRLFTK